MDNRYKSMYQNVFQNTIIKSPQKLEKYTDPDTITQPHFIEEVDKDGIKYLKYKRGNSVKWKHKYNSADSELLTFDFSPDECTVYFSLPTAAPGMTDTGVWFHAYKVSSGAELFKIQSKKEEEDYEIWTDLKQPILIEKTTETPDIKNNIIYMIRVKNKISKDENVNGYKSVGRYIKLSAYENNGIEEKWSQEIDLGFETVPFSLVENGDYIFITTPYNIHIRNKSDGSEFKTISSEEDGHTYGLTSQYFTHEPVFDGDNMYIGAIKANVINEEDRNYARERESKKFTWEINLTLLSYNQFNNQNEYTSQDSGEEQSYGEEWTTTQYQALGDDEETIHKTPAFLFHPYMEHSNTICRNDGDFPQKEYSTGWHSDEPYTKDIIMQYIYGRFSPCFSKPFFMDNKIYIFNNTWTGTSQERCLGTGRAGRSCSGYKGYGSLCEDFKSIPNLHILNKNDTTLFRRFEWYDTKEWDHNKGVYPEEGLATFYDIIGNNNFLYIASNKGLYKYSLSFFFLHDIQSNNNIVTIENLTEDEEWKYIAEIDDIRSLTPTNIIMRYLYSPKMFINSDESIEVILPNYVKDDYDKQTLDQYFHGIFTEGVSETGGKTLTSLKSTEGTTYWVERILNNNLLPYIYEEPPACLPPPTKKDVDVEPEKSSIPLYMYIAVGILLLIMVVLLIIFRKKTKTKTLITIISISILMGSGILAIALL